MNTSHNTLPAVSPQPGLLPAARCPLPAARPQSGLLPAASCQLPAELNGSSAAVPAWHVLWTRSRSERLVHEQLAVKGFQLFLPMIDVWTRRKGIRQRTRVPMFPGYLFLHHTMDKQSYLAAIEARGLVRILGEGWERLATVSEREMETIRRVEVSGLPTSHSPYLREGQRVRITHGLLAGIEGIFVRSKPNKGFFVIAIDLLQRSVAVEMDVTMVEAA